MAQRNARKVASPCRRGKVAIDIISGWLTTKRTPGCLVARFELRQSGQNDKGA
nr:hypothetical protein [Proteus mirabilis]